MFRILGALFVAMAAIPAVAGDKAGEVTTLGRVFIDKHEATVTLKNPTATKDHFIVTIEVIRPKGSPRIKSDRIQVWLLRRNFKSQQPALIVEDGLEGEFLPERNEEKGSVARATVSFDAEEHQRKQLAAIVVAVDGEPVAFKLSPAAK